MSMSSQPDRQSWDLRGVDLSPLKRLIDIEPLGPAEMLLDPILGAGGATVLYGDSEAGKSYLACAIAVSVASGRSVIKGITVKRRASVLVLDAEDQASRWRSRMDEIVAGAGIALPDNIVIDTPYVDIVRAANDLRPMSTP
jgi:RecA-family ATPase